MYSKIVICSMPRLAAALVGCVSAFLVACGGSGEGANTTKALSRSPAVERSAALQATGVSAPQEAGAPTVHILSPSEGAVIAAPGYVDIVVEATDNGRVTRVDLSSGGKKMGDYPNAPYTSRWGPLPVGSYALTATAVDNEGLRSSTTVTFEVRALPPTRVMGSASEGSTTDYITDASGAYINANQVQVETPRMITTVRAKVNAVQGRYQFAILTDNNGEPGAVVAQTGEVAATVTGWQTYRLRTPLPVAAGERYWLAVWSNDVGARVFAEPQGHLHWGLYPYQAVWPPVPELPGQGSFTYSIYATDE
jgi:hypothetical protein